MCIIVLLNKWQGFKRKSGRMEMETGPGNQDELSLLSENKENISTLIPDGHWNSTKYKPSSLNKTKLVNFISFSINKFLSIKSLLEWYVPENNIPLHP